MAACSSHETHSIYPNLNTTPLNNQQLFRLNKINEVKDYFVAQIKGRKLMSKRLSKYIVSFDYFNQSLIALLVTTFINCFICYNWQHFYCIICNCYWSTCRDSKCRFQSCISNFYMNCGRLLKKTSNKKQKAC